FVSELSFGWSTRPRFQCKPVSPSSFFSVLPIGLKNERGRRWGAGRRPPRRSRLEGRAPSIGFFSPLFLSSRCFPVQRPSCPPRFQKSLRRRLPPAGRR